MPVTAPNTYGVAQAIQTIAQALTITPIGGISGYKTVSIGATKDVVDLLPVLEITGADDETERESMNAIGNPVDIQDDQMFQLTTIVDYTDSQTAEQLVMALRDALTQKLHSSASLGNTAGVIGVYVNGQGKYGYIQRQGVWYRIHQIKVKPDFWYSTTIEA